MITSYIYLSFLPFSFLFSIAAFFLSVKNIKNKRYCYFFHYLFCADGILIGKTVEFFSKSEFVTLMAGRITYAFIALIGVFWVLFICQWTHSSTKIFKPESLILISTIPFFTIFLQSTNQIHHLVWKANHFEQCGNFLINVVTQYGPWFYVHSFYSYGLFITGCIILCAENVGLWKKYKVRSFLLLSGISVPVLLSLFYVLRDPDQVVWDFSAGSYAITSFLFAIVIIKYDFFTLPQPSRKNILNSVPFGLITVTPEGLIIDITKAAAEQLENDELIGENLKNVLKNEDGSDIQLFEFSLNKKEQICSCNGRLLKISVVEHREKEILTAYVLLTKEFLIEDEKIKTSEDLFNAINSVAQKAGLTKRESEILKELLGNDTNKEIAFKLNISNETVHTHVSRILKKLNCKNREELRKMALGYAHKNV